MTRPLAEQPAQQPLRANAPDHAGARRVERQAMTRPLAALRAQVATPPPQIEHPIYSVCMTTVAIDRATLLALLDCAVALALADAWYGLDGDGITDPVRGSIKAALAALERAGWSARP